MVGNAWSAFDAASRLNECDRRIVIDWIGVHAANDRQIIGDSAKDIQIDVGAASAEAAEFLEGCTDLLALRPLRSRQRGNAPESAGG